MIDRILAFFGVYWYLFYETGTRKIYAYHLGDARRQLFNPNSVLIDTNDRSVV